MKTVVVNWPELKKAILKAGKLEMVLYQLDDQRQRLFWYTKINHYCDPNDSLYMSEHYYQEIKDGIQNEIDKQNKV